MRSPLRSFRLVLSAMSAAMLIPSAAMAYRPSVTSTGVELHWSDTAFPLEWYFGAAGSKDVGPDASIAAWTAALDSWQAVSCSKMTWRLAGTLDTPEAAGGDGRNDVVVYEDRWFQGADAALAITTPVYSDADGILVDADTVFNGQLKQWAVDGDPGRADLQAVATHEFGHALGLDHPCEVGGFGGDVPDCCDYSQGSCTPKPEYFITTMYPATDPGETWQRTLADDDIAGICHLYDSGEPPPPPSGGLGSACESPGDCTSGLCVLLTDGSSVCTEPCDGTCPEPGYRCEPQADGGGVCLADLADAGGQGGDPADAGGQASSPADSGSGCSTSSSVPDPAGGLLVFALLGIGTLIRRWR